MSVDMTTEELKRLAAEITPGPWNSSIHGTQVLTGDSWNTICEIRVRKDFSAAKWEDGRGSSDPTANARAIALVPDLLRELIERREADAPVTAREAEQESKIVERKFYHSEWKLTDLLAARHGGLVTDEGEAWSYRYSHKDGTGGKYDLMFRREPVDHPPQPSETVAEAAEIERLTKVRDNLSRLEQLHREQANEQFHRAEKAEAALSESQALLAEAFEVAAAMLETLGHVCESGETLAHEVRALTPADAKAALESYGRDKLLQGVQRAVDVVEDYCADDPMLAGHGHSASIRDAILADMENQK